MSVLYLELTCKIQVKTLCYSSSFLIITTPKSKRVSAEKQQDVRWKWKPRNKKKVTRFICVQNMSRQIPHSFNTTWNIWFYNSDVVQRRFEYLMLRVYALYTRFAFYSSVLFATGLLFYIIIILGPQFLCPWLLMNPTFSV